MIIRKATVGLSFALLALAIAPPANCGILTYTNESSFLAAMSAPNMESFESFIASPPTPADSFTMTDFTMSALPAVGNPQPLHSPALHARLGPDLTLNISATDGTAFVLYNSDANETLRFVFNSPQQGFGVNIVDWGDWGVGSLILSDDAGNSFTVATTPQGDGNQLFFGVVNTQATFSRIDLLSQPVLNSFGIDEVYYGANVVPEPRSFILWAGVLAMVLVHYLSQRRRGRSACFRTNDHRL